MSDPEASRDPVLARRARFARTAELGQRLGYGLVLTAMLGFAVGLVVGFDNRAVTTVVVAALVGTTFTLLPAIIVAYSVKAAEREDRERQR